MKFSLDALANVFHIQILIDAVLGALVTKSGLLDSTEWRLNI